MRILWITEFFPASGRGEITGGVEARCFYVSKYLRKLGHEVKIIGRRTTGETWHPPSFVSIPERIIFTIKAIIEGLKQNFDVVEGTNFATYPVAWLLGFLKNKPVVFWYPDVFAGSWVEKIGWVGIIGELADWVLFRLPVAKYLAISATTKQKLVTAGIAEDNIKVVYCGMESEEISAVKAGGKIDIVAVSRLLSYKRIEDLIRAAEILQKDFPKISIEIIGRGPNKNRLESLVAELKLGKNIIFRDYIPSHRKLLSIVKSALVFCHPSTVEGFGIAPIEAAALGKPLVLADISVFREITENGRGTLFFEPKNPQDLAEKIRMLLEDEKLYKQKAREAKELAKKYNWKEIAKETEEVYQKCYENLHVD